MCYVYTSGYEGLTIQQFIDKLVENNIDRIIDIRENPISRKKGFSKRAMSSSLADCGIQYIHMRELGSPKELRGELLETKDYSAFFQNYRCHAVSHLDSIVEIWQYASKGRVCLLCFEKDSRTCHRSVISSILKEEMPGVDGIVNL